METKSKLEGFEGEIRIVVPPVVISENLRKGKLDALYITDIGYYPKAKHHYCHRPEGSEEHILLHCVDGRGVVHIGKETFTLEANKYMLIPAGNAHTYQADDIDPWTIHWMHFIGRPSDDLVQKIFRRIQENKNVLSFDGEVQRIFDRFCKLLSKGYSREILEYIDLTLSYFFCEYLYPDLAKDKHVDGTDIIELAIEFLKTNIGNRIGLQEIASNVNLSVSHFSKLFKSRTGYSPIEYLNHLKVQKACYLLQFSDERISMISYDLGFDDQYYFSRLFKEHMGVSPSSYRTNLNQDNNKIH